MEGHYLIKLDYCQNLIARVNYLLLLIANGKTYLTLQFLPQAGYIYGYFITIVNLDNRAIIIIDNRAIINMMKFLY